MCNPKDKHNSLIKWNAYIFDRDPTKIKLKPYYFYGYHSINNLTNRGLRTFFYLLGRFYLTVLIAVREAHPVIFQFCLRGFASRRYDFSLKQQEKSKQKSAVPKRFFILLN